MRSLEGAFVFVKIDEYKGILNTINLIKNKLKEARDTLDKINELKNREDSELELWNSEIDDVERKVDFIDKAIFEPDAL